MATLKDIGAELGLSAATVSRALNGFPEVNPQTRARVCAMAEQLDYRPNRSARRLVTGKSGLVAMILRIQAETPMDLSIFQILMGLSEALGTHDIDLVTGVDSNDDLVLPYRRMINRNMVDGFILNAPTLDDPRIAFLRKQGTPFVVHGQASSEPDYPFCSIDNKGVSAISVELLAALKHRRIALINGERTMAFAAERLSGFRTATNDFGILVPERFTSHGPSTENHGYIAALSMLSGQHGLRPSAIIASSTPIAAGVLRAASHLGLSVPEDLSLIAHDDALQQLRAVEFEPTLTVTRAPLRDACAPLAEALIARIGGAPAESLQSVTQAQLIVRNSTGPVPASEKEPWR